MTNVFIAGGGGSGVGSDDCTATAADVRKGKTFVGADTNDETGVGTLDASDFDLDGTAAVGDVLSGKTFYSDNAASKRTGTLSLSGTAATSDVLSGKTFYNNDAKSRQTGTIPSNSTDGAVTLAQNTSGNYCNVLFPYGFYPRYASGQSNTRMRITNAALASAIGLIASKIANGMTIIGVTGTYKTPLSGNASASEVLAGKTFYSNDAGTKQTGTLVNRGSSVDAQPDGLWIGGSGTDVSVSVDIPEGAYKGTSASNKPQVVLTNAVLKTLIASLGSFSVSQYSGTQCAVNVTGPKGLCSGAKIMMKWGSYPTNHNDGNEAATTLQSLTGFLTTLPDAASHYGQTAYFRAFPFLQLSDGQQIFDDSRYSDASVVFNNPAFETFITQSGTWTVPSGVGTIDIFLCGGGGGGGNGGSTTGGGGGGGGYTTMQWAVKVTPGQQFNVVIGAGGAAGQDGGATSFGSYSVAGGKAGYSGLVTGGAGGCGGGNGWRTSVVNAGNGGTDGGNGTDSNNPAKGQGHTTRPFDDTSRDAYAGGGGGGGNGRAGNPHIGGRGGSIGGGSGAGRDDDGNMYGAEAGHTNTGGGGGGGAIYNNAQGAAGGSGLVIVRGY